ncbi:aldehyde dehydrogenase family protein [Streptomyces sp. NPDC102259]|uniref:aldehyde dehydrogenase family protein n=1 Tax=Streptomyces sp. NPDC102259 TaxID=3366148 RepID=UPI0038042B5C
MAHRCTPEAVSSSTRATTKFHHIEGIDDAVRAAEAALPAWRDTSPAVRGELLYRWAELVRWA